MQGRLHNVIYGKNLVEELKYIVQKPYLVVTMEDLLPIFKDKFDDGAIFYTVDTLEYDELMKVCESFTGFEAVVGLGGGQAVDVAKVFSWKTHKPLYQVPTSIATNAVFGHRAGLRFSGVVRYVLYTEPVAVYIDYDVIQNGPKSLNRSGVCDVFCYHNSVYDWKWAQDNGKCEPYWPYEEDKAQQVREVYNSVVDAVDDIYALNEKGIRTLSEGLRWGGAAYHNFGWNPRPIEGTDHSLFYSLEYCTGKKFIHGQPVCLGIYTGSEMTGNDPDGILDLIHRAGVEIRPEGMGITWDDVAKSLYYLSKYCNENKLWYTIAHEYKVTDAFVQKVRDKVVAKYGEWGK